MVDYAISNASLPAQLTLFDGQMQGLFDYVREIAQDDERIRESFSALKQASGMDISLWQ